MSDIEEGYCWPLNPRQRRELEEFNKRVGKVVDELKKQGYEIKPIDKDNGGQGAAIEPKCSCCGRPLPTVCEACEE